MLEKLPEIITIGDFFRKLTELIEKLNKLIDYLNSKE